LGSEHKSGFALEMERRARLRAREDARRARAEQRSKTYTGADLAPFYAIDPATGCWIWIGEFRTYGDGDREIPITRGLGKHVMCGTAHNAMSRVLYEEQLGRNLKATENVAGACESNRGTRHACVNPDHHELRHGAGIMFAREMVE
jgi:hypothetical protein